jgi:hypothetical protein
MTPEAYRELLDELHLSPGAAARILGIAARTSRRWLDGTRDVSAPGYRLLVLLRDYGISPAEALEHFSQTIPETSEPE